MDKSQQRNEQISALVDDELSAQEKGTLLAHLKTSREDQKTWECYHLIKSVLERNHHKLMLGAGLNLAAKVRAAIAKEPTVSWGTEFDRPVVMNAHHANQEKRDQRTSTK
jgi:negative regulator of sigma E activity